MNKKCRAQHIDDNFLQQLKMEYSTSPFKNETVDKNVKFLRLEKIAKKIPKLSFTQNVKIQEVIKSPTTMTSQCSRTRINVPICLKTFYNVKKLRFLTTFQSNKTLVRESNVYLHYNLLRDQA